MYMTKARQSEDFTRRHYKRIVYADTLCKEITTASIQTLELNVRVLHVFAITTEKMAGKFDREDEHALSKLLESVIFKAKFLRREVDDMDRMVEVLESVGILDQALHLCTSEIPGLCLECEHVSRKRERMETVVSETIIYDETKFSCKRDYEEQVSVETDKRLKEAETKASTVLAYTVACFKRNGFMKEVSGDIHGHSTDQQERGILDASKTNIQ